MLTSEELFILCYVIFLNERIIILQLTTNQFLFVINIRIKH